MSLRFFQLGPYRPLRSEEEGAADIHKEHFLDGDDAVSREPGSDHQDQEDWPWASLGRQPQLKHVTIVVASLILVLLPPLAGVIMWTRSQNLQPCLSRTSAYCRLSSFLDNRSSPSSNFFSPSFRGGEVPRDRLRQRIRSEQSISRSTNASFGKGLGRPVEP